MEKFKSEDVIDCILIGVEGNDWMMTEMKSDFSQLNPTITSHLASIKLLETQLGKILTLPNLREKGGLPSDIVANP